MASLIVANKNNEYAYLPNYIDVEGKTYTVTSIGQKAFENCNFTNLSIPTTVTSIHDEAFKNCKNLEKIIIPQNVSRMGQYVFEGCENVKIYIKETYIPSGWSYNWHMFAVNIENPVYIYSQDKPSQEMQGEYWHGTDSEPIIWER